MDRVEIRREVIGGRKGKRGRHEKRKIKVDLLVIDSCQISLNLQCFSAKDASVHPLKNLKALDRCVLWLDLSYSLYQYIPIKFVRREWVHSMGQKIRILSSGTDRKADIIVIGCDSLRQYKPQQT